MNEKREILFRGKRLKYGEWIEGYVFDDGIAGSERMFVGGLVITDYHGTACNSCEVGIDFDEVDPSTVGQYTGLKDKNGTKIFEGDIVDILCENEEVGVIEWSEDTAQFIVQADGFAASFDNYWGKDLEIIGNIYDDPELLKKVQLRCETHKC